MSNSTFAHAVAHLTACHAAFLAHGLARTSKATRKLFADMARHASAMRGDEGHLTVEENTAVVLRFAGVIAAQTKVAHRVAYVAPAEAEPARVLSREAEADRANGRDPNAFGAVLPVHISREGGAYFWNTSRATAGRRGPFPSETATVTDAALSEPSAAHSFHYSYGPEDDAPAPVAMVAQPAQQAQAQDARALPRLVAEFRAIMSADRGTPSAEHCRAVIEHVASALPVGPEMWALWHVDHGAAVATLCEFDGSTCFECYRSPARAVRVAARLNADSYSQGGRYIVARIPAGVAGNPCDNPEGEAPAFRASGPEVAWSAGMEYGFTFCRAAVADLCAPEGLPSVELVQAFGKWRRAGDGWTPPACDALVYARAEVASLSAPAMVPQVAQQAQAAAAPVMLPGEWIALCQTRDHLTFTRRVNAPTEQLGRLAVERSENCAVIQMTMVRAPREWAPAMVPQPVQQAQAYSAPARVWQVATVRRGPAVVVRMVPQQVQQQQALDVRATPEAHAARVGEARPFTVTLTCGDIFAHSAEGAARAFREGMQADYAAWPLMFEVRHQDSGAVAYVELQPEEGEAAPMVAQPVQQQQAQARRTAPTFGPVPGLDDGPRVDPAPAEPVRDVSDVLEAMEAFFGPATVWRSPRGCPGPSGVIDHDHHGVSTVGASAIVVSALAGITATIVAFALAIFA